MRKPTSYKWLSAFLTVALTVLPFPSNAETLVKIGAKVTGILYFEPGHGYFISANPHADASNRVWLSISEQKMLVRDLENLQGKFVEASGPLKQMSANTKAAIPPLSMYLSDFSIAPAKDQNRN
jgi:hypothetical protein